MKDLLFKYIHIFIFLYGAWDIFGIHDEFLVQQEQLQGQLDAQKAQLEKAQLRVKRIDDNQQKIAEYESALQKLESEFETLKIKMPPRSDQPKILQDLSTVARDLNIKTIVFNPLPSENRTDYVVNKVELSGKGTFLQFLLYLEQISKSERFFYIDQVLMTKSADQQKGRFVFVETKSVIQTFEHQDQVAIKGP